MTSRFNVVQAPPQQPGHCWITHTAVGPFVDTGVDVSVGKIDRGRMYISISVLREMAQIAGLFEEKEPASVELRKKEWFDKGYQQAMEEVSNDVVSRFIEHASRNLVGVTGNTAMVESASSFASAGAAIPSVEDSTAGTSEGVEDNGGSELESASTGSFERPVGVSTNSSDDSQYRL
jgi:hypothetical protein